MDENTVNNIIRVGWYESSCFQEGMSDDAPKSGYAYEYYQRIADYTGWEYDYVYGEWSDLFEMLENGEIDLLAGVSITEEREETMLFPDYQIGTDNYYLYQHSDDMSMKEDVPSSFSGKKIGGIRNNRMTYFLEKWIKENNLGAEIVLYEGFSGRDRAFATNEIDGIVATDNNIKSNSEYAPVTKIGEEPFYVAVSRNRTDILTELNSVHKTLISLSPGYLDTLQLKCYGATLSNSTASKEESEWIDAHSVLRVGYVRDYMPFCGEEDGNVTGVITDVIPKIIDNVHLTDRVTLEYVGFNSFKDMAESLAAGSIDLSFPVINDRNNLNEMNITGSSDIITVPFYVGYKGTYSDATFDTIVLNSRPIRAITDNYPNSKLVTAKSADECLNLILDGEATCTIMASYRLKYILNDPRYRDILTMPFSASVTYCVGVGKESKELLSILNKGIAFLDNARTTDSAFKYIQSGATYTFMDFARDNVFQFLIVGSIFFALVILCLSLYLGSVRKEKRVMEMQFENVNILAALSQDYEAVHIVDLDAGTFSSIRSSVGMERISMAMDTTPYAETVEKMVNIFVLPEAREEFLQFLDADKMKERVEKENKFTYRFPVVSDVDGRYIYEMTFVRVSDDISRHLMVIGTKCIDDILKIEREEGLYNAALLQDCVFFYEFNVTDGRIDGDFTCRGGYNPLFNLELDFPMPYDEFNEIRADKLGIKANTEEEGAYWTCEGLKKAFESGKKTVTIRYSSEDLNLFWNATVIITEDENSHHLHAVYICKDVTETVEADLKQKRELEKALANAEVANNAKTSFLFNMSHDIRTPMNAIIGFRNLLEKYQDDPVKREDYLKKIQDASNVLLSIINNVLEMARIEKGTIEIDEKPWCVEQFNDTLNAVFQEMMIEKNIEFTRELRIKHDYVYCDPIKLREVFMNIISNAYKYTEPGGSVKMLLEEFPGKDDNEILLRTTIADSGIGMSEEFLPHIYEEFAREYNTTDNKIEGTGLGMPIVKRLVELMNGTIEVQSKKGVGTTFVVTIPHKIAAPSLQADSNVADVDKEAFKGKRILLAEDNDLNAEIAIEILTEMGFLIERADDGDTCVEMLRQSEPGYYDLVLMDIQMPRMNGYDATGSIRTLDDDEKAFIPILAMTANAFEEDKKKAYMAGMNGHVAKPVNVDELMGELAKIVKK